MRDKTINILKYLLPLLFIAYIGSNTLFVHVHKVNGEVIVHSHPFKSHHQHSTAEFETISILSNIIEDGNIHLFASLLLFSSFIVLLFSKTEESIHQSKCSVISLRAPPFSI